jgi:putative transposase
MKNSNEIRTGRHCVFNLHVHLVFVTKCRCKVFTKTILEEMRAIFEKVCKDFESVLDEFDGDDEHVHLLVNYPPKVSVSKLVNSLKGVSSRHLRKRFAELEKRYWKGVLWSPSYFAASCGGAPLSVIRQYIEQQKTPD